MRIPPLLLLALIPAAHHSGGSAYLLSLVVPALKLAFVSPMKRRTKNAKARFTNAKTVKTPVI
jgi:hypothetical protein